MPTAVTAIAAFIVGAGASATALAIAEAFVYVAASYLLNRAAAALAPRERSSGLGTGTEVNYYDSGAPVRIVYGQVKTGGMDTIPPYTSGPSNALLHKVLTLAGHEVDSYNFTHFDATTITNAHVGTVAFTNSDGMVNSGTIYDGHAFVRRYRGTSTDSADRMLMEANSIAFNNFRGRGIAKAAITLKYNTNIYSAVPTVTFTYQGKRCYDPRLDVTPGANPTNPSYIAWTRNVALCTADYLMSDLGGSYASADIDWDTVVTAANYCDGLVNIPGSTTQARYTCNGVLFATDEFTDNLKSLVDAMLGRIIFRDGKWRMYAGSWQTPSFTIQKSDWISPLSIRFEQGKKKRFNQMRTWYVDPAREWQRVESLPRTNSIYKAADGAELLDAETEQLLCTNEFEAQRKGESLLRQSRNQIVVAGRLPPRFQDIALWNTGTIVFDHLGWSSKTFRAVGIDMNPDGSMDCVFAEEQSTDWTDLDAADYNSQSVAVLPATNVTTPTEPPGFSATPQVNGTILFDWTTPVVKPFNTEFQIIRSSNSADASVGTVVWQGVGNPVALVMPTSPHWYSIRAVAPNSAISAYMPNTFGTFAMASNEAGPFAYTRAISDPEFRSGFAVRSYWRIGPESLGMTVIASGGVDDFAGKISFNPASGYDGGSSISCAPIRPKGVVISTSYGDVAYPISPLQWANVYLTYRRTSTLTGSLGAGGNEAGFRLHLDVIQSIGGILTTASLISSATAYRRVDNLTLNQWVTFATSAQVPNSTWAGIVPIVSISAGQVNSGGLEIGRFQVSIQ